MSEAIISLENPDEELAVLGSRDQLLRQVRDQFRVRVLARSGGVRIEGDPQRVEQARKVIEAMRRLYRRQGTLTSNDVGELIDEVVASEHLPDQQSRRLEIHAGHKTVNARTEGQARYLEALRSSELVFCIGPAGTGKTYLAVASAVAALRQGRIKKIILVRPAVEAGERLGYLPGDMEAKINPYLRPLFDALNDLLDFDLMRRYLANDLIEIAPLAFMRGRTLNDAVIILDEGQNATVAQMKMFLTRMGQNARVVVTGDITQVDLPAGTQCGLSDAVARLNAIAGVAVVTLDRSDIVRHPLVQAIVNAYEQTEPPVTAVGTSQVLSMELPAVSESAPVG